MSKDLPASLPMAGAVLRSLVVLNWLYGGAILVLLLGCAPDLLLGRVTSAIEAATSVAGLH